LAQAHEVRDLGVVGIGIGGSEVEFPPEAYAHVYETARSLGFHTTAHAGEAAGPANIRSAVDVLKVERIGHATCVLQDQGLLERLRDKGVAVEACPISNLRTGVIRQLADHPIKRLMEAGVCVSVNTDDPTMFATSLDEELMALHETFGFGYSEARLLTLNAIESAFCDEPTKARLRREVELSYQRL
jgi:adenosine deaminase